MPAPMAIDFSALFPSIFEFVSLAGLPAVVPVAPLPAVVLPGEESAAAAAASGAALADDGVVAAAAAAADVVEDAATDPPVVAGAATVVAGVAGAATVLADGGTGEVAAAVAGAVEGPVWVGLAAPAVGAAAVVSSTFVCKVASAEPEIAAKEAAVKLGAPSGIGPRSTSKKPAGETVAIM